MKIPTGDWRHMHDFHSLQRLRNAVLEKLFAKVCLSGHLWTRWAGSPAQQWARWYRAYKNLFSEWLHNSKSRLQAEESPRNSLFPIWTLYTEATDLGFCHEIWTLSLLHLKFPHLSGAGSMPLENRFDYALHIQLCRRQLSTAHRPATAPGLL